MVHFKQLLADSQYPFDNQSCVYAAQHFNYRCRKETVLQITPTARINEGDRGEGGEGIGNG